MKKLLLMIGLVLGVCGQADAQFRIKAGGDSPLKKLQIAEVAINNLYVDSVNEEKLVEDAIRGMLKELDPHSSYTTAKETKAMNEPLQGDFEGIGVQFNMADSPSTMARRRKSASWPATVSCWSTTRRLLV